jgi:protein ImuB
MHWIALLPPEAERTAWGWRALQFTPRVAQVDEALLLEVSTSQRLWGGQDRLLRRLFRRRAQPVPYAEGATHLVALALLRLQLRGLPVPAQVPGGLPLAALTPRCPGCTRWSAPVAAPGASCARCRAAAWRGVLARACWTPWTWPGVSGPRPAPGWRCPRCLT